MSRAAWVLLLALCVTGCSNRCANWQDVEVDGVVYRYRVLPQHTEDLDTDLLNVTNVATEHCDLTISDDIDSLLPRAIKWAEDGYGRVSADLGFDCNSQRPKIYFLSTEQYAAYSPSTSLGCLDYYEPVARLCAFVDAGRCYPLNEAGPAVFAHELTHFVEYGLLGYDGSRSVQWIRGQWRQMRCFSEGLAREESPTHDTLAVRIQQSFPDRAYYTSAQLNTDLTDDEFSRAMVQCRALVRMLKEEGRPGAVGQVCRLVGRVSLERAVCDETGWSGDELFARWCAYMDRLRSEGADGAERPETALEKLMDSLPRRQ